MRARVACPFVKPNARDVPIDIRLELHAHFNGLSCQSPAATAGVVALFQMLHGQVRCCTVTVMLYGEL